MLTLCKVKLSGARNGGRDGGGGITPQQLPSHTTTLAVSAMRTGSSGSGFESQWRWEERRRSSLPTRFSPTHRNFWEGPSACDAAAPHGCIPRLPRRLSSLGSEAKRRPPDPLAECPLCLLAWDLRTGRLGAADAGAATPGGDVVEAGSGAARALDTLKDVWRVEYGEVDQGNLIKRLHEYYDTRVVCPLRVYAQQRKRAAARARAAEDTGAGVACRGGSCSDDDPDDVVWPYAATETQVATHLTLHSPGTSANYANRRDMATLAALRAARRGLPVT